ncbi:MAG: hypothetical protein WCJ02_01985 [bacterium]
MSMRLVVSAMSMLVASAINAQEQNTAGMGVTGSAKHPFVCTDNGKGKVFVVTADGKIEKEFAAPGCQDCWRLANGHYLFTNTRGATEVTPENKIVWSYKSPDKTEIHNCQPLPDGGVMICECGTKRIIEIGRDGKIRKEIPVETNVATPHGQFRGARKLANGNYLIACVGEQFVRELDPAGKVIRSIKVPGNPFIAIRLPNGNTLVGCGDAHKVLEIDPSDKIVWEVKENDIPNNQLRFVAGLQRLPNGNTVICNWGGHGCVGKQPQLVEITPEKKIVWQVFDNTQFKTISNIQLLDVPGDGSKNELLR